VGVDPDWMAWAFARAQSRLAQELFQRNPQVWYDVAHPRQQHPLTFLIAGLAYGLDESAPAILDDPIRARLATHVFPAVDDVQISVAALCVDPTQAPNALDSFLGKNYADQIERLLGSDASATFTPDAIVTFVEETVERLLSAIDDMSLWLRLTFGLGHLPPAVRLRGPLAALFQHLDLVALYRADPTVGTLTLQAVARQAAALGDAAASRHLCDQLVPVVRVLAEREVSGALRPGNGVPDPVQYHMLQLLEASIHLIITAHPDQTVVPTYSTLLRQLVDANPTAAVICRPFVQRLCTSLPIAQAQHFWSLLVRLRAE
jgi:hypothetical protein